MNPVTVTRDPASRTAAEHELGVYLERRVLLDGAPATAQHLPGRPPFTPGRAALYVRVHRDGTGAARVYLFEREIGRDSSAQFDQPIADWHLAEPRHACYAVPDWLTALLEAMAAECRTLLLP